MPLRRLWKAMFLSFGAVAMVAAAVPTALAAPAIEDPLVIVTGACYEPDTNNVRISFYARYHGAPDASWATYYVGDRGSTSDDPANRVLARFSMSISRATRPEPLYDHVGTPNRSPVLSLGPDRPNLVIFLSVVADYRGTGVERAVAVGPDEVCA